jgi:Rrf2 family protein
MACTLKISEAASLALHAAGLMATKPGQSLSTKSIAESFSVSEAHLSKVLQRLGKVGLLRSTRGPRGGFTLTRAPSEVTLLEVFEAIEGPLHPGDCLFENAICDGETCVLGRVLREVNGQLVKHLANTTLAQVGTVFDGDRFQGV